MLDKLGLLSWSIMINSAERNLPREREIIAKNVPNFRSRFTLVVSAAPMGTPTATSGALAPADVVPAALGKVRRRVPSAASAH
jgi:hypothetical protein